MHVQLKKVKFQKEQSKSMLIVIISIAVVRLILYWEIYLSVHLITYFGVANSNENLINLLLMSCNWLAKMTTSKLLLCSKT